MRRRDLILLAGSALGPAGAARADATLGILRPGGLVLLLRHARTVPGTGDPPGFSLDDCATQRNLSETGRAQARQIGARLRAARVPIYRVLSSAWCRCQETARLLGLGPVEHFQPLDSFFEDRDQRDRHREGMLGFIEAWRGPGNALLVTHQVNITAVSELFPASGEIVGLSGGPEPEVTTRLRLWETP